MPKFYIKTYGCQMNERDSEQVAHSLIERGYQSVAHESEADVVLLNTCSVRDMADQKALGKMGMMRQIAKRRPEVVFGFLGCMAQARGDSLFEGLPHLDLVVGTQKFHRVADYVEELVDVIRDAVELLRPDDQIEMRQPLEKRIASRLGHAIEETEDHLRVPLRDRATHAHLAERLLVGHVAYAAGIQ